MRRLRALLCVGAVACSSGTVVGGGPDATPTPAPISSPSDRNDGRETPRFPGYRARLPRQPAAVADLLVDIYKRLPKEIDRWLEEGGRLGRSDEVHRGALTQQRLFRRLARKQRLYRKVERRLPRLIGRVVGRHINAQAQLSSLATPVEPPVRWKTYRPESPHMLRRFYSAAARRFDVPWQVLASVNAVESRFGRILGPSSAGALGPMQFIPSTWDIYGRGDIMDPRDSIMAAARYLAASGAPRNMRGALFAYNRSDAYVDAILTYAREMRREKRSFYAYYFWEVFVRTTKGDVRLTGPGT